jgi:CRP/FNR family cyclic AMP-dependent transcriptional regulator
MQPDSNSSDGKRTGGAAAIIAAHPLLGGLAPQHLDLLSEVAMFTEFKTDEIIFHEGDPANRFYLLLEGQVVLESKDPEKAPVVLQTINGGDVLGWSWLFPPYYWHFDARATKPTRALFFYGTWLLEKCEEDHDFGYEMMKRMAAIMIKRLQATRKQLVQHAGE